MRNLSTVGFVCLLKLSGRHHQCFYCRSPSMGTCCLNGDLGTDIALPGAVQ